MFKSVMNAFEGAGQSWGKKLLTAQNKGLKVPGVNYVKPEWNNMFLGLEVNKGVSTAAGVGIMGYAVAKEGTHPLRERREAALANQTDTGGLPSVGYDLGVTGNLVFGLHKARKGGGVK